MKLSSGKIRNLTALRKEKDRLLQQKAGLESDFGGTITDLFNKSKVASGVAQDATTKSNKSAVNISGYFLHAGNKLLVKNILSPILKGFGQIIVAFIKEFVGGYLKWKAIELSFKGLRYLATKKKDEE